MSFNADWVKLFLTGRHEEIARAHREGASGLATCAALTAMMDEAMRTVFESFSPAADRSAHDHVAVLALGGYGRAELFPKSDIDVMVLCESGERKDDAAEIAKEFLHVLWDAGVDIGHSVRTIEEALALQGKSADSWASMMESRFLCGKEALSTRLSAEFARREFSEPDRWFIGSVLADAASRHQRYGHSVKLLEPNIKKSAGGLRDLHALFWLYRVTDRSYWTPIDPSAPACRTFLTLLQKGGQLAAEELASAISALEFLFRTRHEMHYRRDSLHDALEYTLQLEVAEGLGYGPKENQRSVEVFMREYYLHARIIHGLYRSLSQQYRELLEPVQHSSQQGERVNDTFAVREDLLTVDPSIRQFAEARQILEAFAYAAENDVDLGFRLRGVIERSAELMDETAQRSEELASLFRRILRSKRVAPTLHAMNELNILGRYLPEFGELVAFFQHNVYHYFTADEHTLIAVANAEQLREQGGFLREVFRNLKRKDLLYVTILLHDIAKPRGVADHEITGVPMARSILQRIGMEDIFPDVAFLIRHHLVMEQTAFRRNIHDPETIKEFAAKFERPEQLDYLYLLTYADLSALNINIWTEWKSSILQDLYLQTAEVLQRNLHGVQIDEFHQAKREAAVVEIVEKLSVSMPRQQVERHLEGMQNDAYISVFSEAEIAQHIHHSSTDEPVSALFAHSEGYTEVTVIAQDAPFALSKFCAVLSANDANIFDANIFTRDDGIIIDRFRVADAASKQRLDYSVCAKIAEDLKQVMGGTMDTEHLFQAHRRKWKRRGRKPLNPTILIDVQFEDNPHYTIIDVYAPDSVGILYRITETISRLGLDIYFAKIATRVDGIIDAFYTLDRTGKPITDAAKRESVRREILATVNAASDQELA